MKHPVGLAACESTEQNYLLNHPEEAALRFETTVQRPVEAKGVGLHSGVPVSIRILPAPPSTGI
ncbi:MAG TPA: UDP-3-O-acyl-N-acetylglucosamine deacetylase, partial [Bryobacteraceae bacterium]|nr:UDP-3-O-acyl-N-acetylglucosamine deacetylase [Bryobacteraceae bacterium]